MWKPVHNRVDVMNSILSRGSINKILRHFYWFQDTFDETNGALECYFDDGSTMGFDAASDGEQLAIYEGVWEDGFQEPLSAENRLFVETHGKWTAVDVSNNPRYMPFIGTKLSAIYGLNNPFGRLAGVMMVLDDQRALIGIAEWDEFDVLDTADLQRLWGDGWTRDELNE